MLQQFGLDDATFNLSVALLSRLASTLVLLIVIAVTRALLVRFIRRTITAPELRRKWLAQCRNGFLLLFILGLLIIWGNELRTLALSVVAIAVAFVVATKELILCITGSILKSVAHSFNLGDRIQVKDFRGDVVDQNLLATTILEVGPGKLTHQRTGRKIVLPNALFVSEPVINESFTHEFVLHVFTVPFKRDEDWQGGQRAILASAERHCQPYLDDVARHMQRLSLRSGLDVPSVEPRVTIQVPTAGEVHLVVRVPAKSAQRSQIEQAILTDIFGSKEETAGASAT